MMTFGIRVEVVTKTVHTVSGAKPQSSLDSNAVERRR
jgi:hypothetical protein